MIEITPEILQQYLVSGHADEFIFICALVHTFIILSMTVFFCFIFMQIIDLVIKTIRGDGIGFI